MKVIIAGGRNFNDYEKLCSYCDYLLQNKDDIEIVSGTAKGADKLGERYANERGYPIKRFPADWGTFGNRAGYLRNEEMAEYGDALIAFWDGESKGTQHMIRIASKKSLEIRIYRYEMDS
jgi:hypothetical protein